MASVLAEALPRPVGLVLGGGAAFGAVQVGMVRALDETGLRPDLVVGTSVGSLNGAVVAAHPAGAGARLVEVWAAVRRRTVFPGGWLARARTLQASRAWLSDSSGIAGLVRLHLPVGRFDQLEVPFAAVATDVLTGRPVVLTDGEIESAVLASSAIPAILPPVEVDGRRLVDGGLVANVPVEQAYELGAASLVVLDCGVLGLRTEAPRTLVESMLHTAAVVVRQQVVRDVPWVAQRVPVVYLPGPFPMQTSPLDFRHTTRLATAAYELSRAFLASVRPDGPGLYGAPALLSGTSEPGGYGGAARRRDLRGGAMDEARPDRLVVDSVAHVRDRFGAEGLRDLVELATHELRRTEAALRELGEETAEAAPAADLAGEADTRTWQAFVDEGDLDEPR